VILVEQHLLLTDESSLSSHCIDLGDGLMHIEFSNNKQSLAKVALIDYSTIKGSIKTSDNAQFYSTSPKITLAPSMLVNQGISQELIAFNFSDSETIRSVKSVTQEETIFFEVNPVFESLARASVANLTSITVPLLNLLLHQRTETLLITAISNHLFVGLQRNDKLQFFNGFSTDTLDELLYYTMLVVQQFQINPSTINVLVIGDFSEKPILKEKLADYFMNVVQLKHQLINDMRYSGLVKLITG
jgi:hypothetical protein